MRRERHFKISFGKTFLCITTLSLLSHIAANSRSLDCVQVIAFLVTQACLFLFLLTCVKSSLTNDLSN